MTTYPKLGTCWLWLVVLTSLVGGCQTMAPSPAPAIPVVVKPWFSLCNPGDGAATVQVYAHSAFQGSAEVNWVARDADRWELEVTDPIGATIVAAKHQGTSIRMRGPLANRIPSVTIAGDNWLVVDGDPIPIKADEVPCLLQSIYPQSWLQRLANRSDDGSTVILGMVDGGRTMTLRLPPLGSGLASCAQIDWRHHLFFHEQLTWCLPRVPGAAGSLTGAGDYSIKWIKLD